MGRSDQEGVDGPERQKPMPTGHGLRTSILNDSELGGIETGRLEHRVHQRLGHARLGLFVNRHHRLFPSQTLGRSEGDDLALARLAHRFGGIVVVLLRHLVGEIGGFDHGLIECFANVGRQAIPELLVDDDCVTQISVLGLRHGLLHFIEFLGVEVGRRILGAVHHPGLQRLINLGERQHLWNGADGAHFHLKNLARLDAHLQALGVCGIAQRLIGAHVLEAVVPIGQTENALGFELFQQPGANGALRDLVQGGVVVEDVGQVEQFEFLGPQRSELGQRRCKHLHRTELQRLHFLLVFIELAVGIDLHLHPALGALFRQFFEVFGGLPFGGVGRDHMAELDDDGLLRPHQGAQTQTGCGQPQTNDCLTTLHGDLR